MAPAPTMMMVMVVTMMTMLTPMLTSMLTTRGTLTMILHLILDKIGSNGPTKSTEQAMFLLVAEVVSCRTTGNTASQAAIGFSSLRFYGTAFFVVLLVSWSS